MDDLFVSGGTSGMGRGLAMHYLRRGTRVTVTGSDRARGEQFLEEAARLGAADRAAFIQADLTKLADNRFVIDKVKARHSKLDGLVLTAMRTYPRRTLTPDGFESTFALYYVSRFVLSYGLTELLERGERPVIVSVGGTGMTKGAIHWDDLTLQHGYSLIRATLQAGRANDLLGVAYAENHKHGKTRFLLIHPGYTNSGTNHVKQPWRTVMRLMGRLFARPVERSIQPMIRLMDDPPPQPLIAWDRDRPVDLSLPTLDRTNALRLYELTKHLLS
ncbi:Oxidoreductase, short chain dehydrogenase/reductase family protein [Thermobacillus xylanilyticus]|jgi:NAD(P)-dependent dehydrogenase (short-subunit alcohol dehydrogenase family)|uniref:Oxidoreductase, short chain dehydrogenase/reductase family protein n=1 Tax=Thermobacillus xylanilyticus TaxID=76633 RepID=A0ABN7RUG6_THEXY|nr:SDR family NAD(P)-dependent oxidoreductase [Thermobacillus xylanilyticus]CAG5080713.1 Oxidoreductase, short chain dehydrogenase/reductase family protein [Thermobacillus xylanilyticus]